MHNKNKGVGNFETAILATTNCHAGAKDGMEKVTFQLDYFPLELDIKAPSVVLI